MALARREYSVLDARRAVEFNRRFAADEDETLLLTQIRDRKALVQPLQDQFAALCDRWDNLYFPSDVLEHAGASHWAHHSSARTVGRAHVSLNSPPVYVDVPASLQSVPPIENMVSTTPDDEGRTMAALAERVYFAWKDEEDFELKSHQACLVKSLYGHTAAKVYWDDDKDRPCLTVIDQPRNLYLGWGSSDYTRLDWALYVYRLSPEAVMENWGLAVDATDDNGKIVPFVVPQHRDQAASISSTVRPWQDKMLEVEVYDYWYRQPKPTKASPGKTYKAVKMETWNAIFVGNVMVKNERHTEYDGKVPYVFLPNTYIPGVSGGRPELYDIESIIREKDERITQGAQMLGRTVDGQYWQIVGPEAPDVVPRGVELKPNKITAPGAGNRIEKIEPWMPEFQLEQYLSRLDRELTDISGLNDLLRGLAPSTVLSSSKAITALVANYEARIRIKRDLFYKWRREVWEMASAIWVAKNKALEPVLGGIARLEISAPSLTPRDDMETSAMAANLVNGKLWSAKRGMDRVGVDDPETEQDIIRAEQTDATLNPAAVQTMVQLMSALQAVGAVPPPDAQAQAMEQARSLEDFRALMGGQQGMPSMNAPEEQPMLPPEALPANGGGFEAGPLRSQTMIQNGQTTGRILSEQKIAPPSEEDIEVETEPGGRVRVRRTRREEG